MRFIHTKSHVDDQGIPPDDFIQQLVVWGKMAPDDLFRSDSEDIDIYTWVRPELGPYTSIEHRKSAMLECMRVLAGFESTWNWNEGPDPEVPPSQQTPYTMEAGAWQISANSRALHSDLADMSPEDPFEFQKKMKEDHIFAMEYTATLLGHTVYHNGPAKRHEIDPWLRRESVGEFTALIYNTVSVD